MNQSRGGKRNGSGRPAGTPNKSTADARRAIAAFVDCNADRLQGWLDQIAQDDPAKAFGLLMQVVEYHVPKLGRTELTGANGGPVQTVTTIEIKAVDP